MPAKIESTYQLINKKLVVYQRPTSEVWQCRYTLDNKKWFCKSTGERDLNAAIPKAHELLISARLLKERSLPVVSKKFVDIAKLAIKRMDDNVGYEAGSDSFPQYKRIANDFLIPFFGRKNINSITPKVMLEYDKWRTEQLGRPLAQSSVRKHNVVLNRIFDEAWACPRFCVNGLMAGSCRSSQRKRNDRKQRINRPPAGGLQKA